MNLEKGGRMTIRMTAVETNSQVTNAIKKWSSAFRQLGTTDHGFDAAVIWVEKLGIWLGTRGNSTADGYRYSNALGTTLGGRELRNLAVEVNPPEHGAPPGLTRAHGVACTVRTSDWGALLCGGRGPGPTEARIQPL